MVDELVPAHVTFMRASGYTESSIETRAEHLRRLDRELPHGLRGATPDELLSWHARPGWAPATRCMYVDHTRVFYRWAAGGGGRAYLGSDPAAGLRRPRVPISDPRPVSDMELERALARSSGHWWLAIILAAYAGLRASELAVQLRENITRDTVTVIHGKGGDSAAVPCHPMVWAAVEERPMGRLIGTQSLPITGRWLSNRGGRYFSQLGLPGVTLHRFRHWFATTMIRGGADVRTVQTLLRHTSLAATARYIRITDRQRAVAVAALPDFTA